jgi:formate-dependent nitrite reductase cytochrome c552 subunit
MALGLVVMLPMGMTMGDGTPPGDTTAADYCGSCHFNPTMKEVVDEWKTSNHANSFHGYNGNTYCASCHSPFQADPGATHSDNDPVPIEEWEGVTCGACHPPHDLRVEWGTPIGNYDVDAGEWVPVYEEDADDLCEFCHTGSRHEKEFQGFGTVMHKKINCIDCHMPDVSSTTRPEKHRTHEFPIPDADNVEETCGLDNDDCHPNHKEDWAVKQIEKGIHEKGSYGQLKKE